MALHVNFAVLEDECCRQSFMRGAFLAGGSVTDPDKRYHLELVTSHQKVSDESYQLLLEMGFSPLDAQRSGSRILYFKRSDMIVDYLTAIGAPVCAMKIIEAKVEKELRNGVNRRCNCDTANLGKAVNAAQQQLQAIRQLRERGKLDTLPEKLRLPLWLFYLEGFSIAELAQTLGVPEGTVKYRLHQARKALKVELTEESEVRHA